jgi:hypothetical protein
MKIFSPQITGSLQVDGNSTMTGSLTVTGGITGSLLGTASFATSASFAPASNPFPFTGSAVITGSLAVTGSVSATSALIMGLDSINTNGINIANKGYTNTIGEFYDGLAIGRGNVLNFQGNGYGSFVIGRDNTIGSGNFTSFNTIIGYNNTISGNGSSRIIAGGEGNIQTGSPTSITSSYSAILGGNLNRIGDAISAGVIVGTNNTASHNNSVVIGGSNIATAANNTVYVPNLDVSGSSTFKNNVTITGSLVIEQNADITAFNLTQFGVSAYAISHGGGYDTTTTIPINAQHTFTGGGNNVYNFNVPLTVNSQFRVSGSTILTGSLNVLGASTYNGTSTFLQPTVFSGSIRGEVRPLSISSNTASLDCSSDNFYSLQLVAGTNTLIEPSNILPGQTINLRINTTGSATVSFPSSVLQSSGSAYVPTTTTGVDVVTFISFDSTSLLLSNVKNFI